MSELERLDPAVIGQLLELEETLGQPGILADTAADFDNHGRTRLAELRDAVAGGNGPEVKRLAHTLKGSAGALGARRLHHLCGQLEASASQDRGSGNALLAAVISEFEAVVAALALQSSAG